MQFVHKPEPRETKPNVLMYVHLKISSQQIVTKVGQFSKSPTETFTGALYRMPEAISEGSWTMLLVTNKSLP